jgi:hypothetical protein
MSLFEECKQALSADFTIIDKEEERVTTILEGYPFVSGNISWSEISFRDFETSDELLCQSWLKNENVYVIADDANIPIFRTNLRLVLENIYDVAALSPKIFIFNEGMILNHYFHPMHYGSGRDSGVVPKPNGSNSPELIGVIKGLSI